MDNLRSTSVVFLPAPRDSETLQPHAQIVFFNFQCCLCPVSYEMFTSVIANPVRSQSFSSIMLDAPGPLLHTSPLPTRCSVLL